MLHSPSLPPPPIKVNISNSAIVVTDFTGNRQKNELSVRSGSLINNISRRSLEWCVGDHRGDIQKFFPTNCVNFLSKEELQYINEVVSKDGRGYVHNYNINFMLHFITFLEETNEP